MSMLLRGDSFEKIEGRNSMVAMAPSYTEIKSFVDMRYVKSDTVRIMWVAWDSCALICSMYLAFVVGLEICMFEPIFSFSADHATILVVDYIVDIFFWVDIGLRVARLYKFVRPRRDPPPDGRRISIRRASWLNSKSGSIMSVHGGSSISPTSQSVVLGLAGRRRRRKGPCGMLCRRSPRAAKLLSFEMVISFISVLPIEVIGAATGTPIAFWRINRVLRVLLFDKYFSTIINFLDYKGVLPGQALMRVPKLFLMMAVAAHWCGSLFYFIARQEAGSGIKDTWASNDHLWEVKHVNTSHPDGPTTKIVFKAPVDVRYVRGLYWATITMVTVGFGDITPTATYTETLFTALVMYIGVVISCSTIGNLTNFVANMDSTSAAHQRKMDDLRKYMHYRRLPADLRNKINHYYEYLWSVTEGVEESTLLGDLPSGLQYQINSHVMARMMLRVDELSSSPTYFLCALAGVMRQRIFSPKEVIVMRRAILPGIYFLCRGVATVMDDRGVEPVNRIEEGGHFKEGSFFEDSKPSTKHVLATSYCEVYILRRTDYFNVCDESKEFSDAHESLLRKLEGKKRGATKAKKFFGDETLGQTEPQALKGCQRAMQQGSGFRQVFDILCFVAIVLYIIFVPLHFVAYHCDEKGFCDLQRPEGSWYPAGYWKNTLLVCLGVLYLVDLFFLADMILNFRFFSFSEDGAPITDRARIRKRYLSTWFWVDFIAALPLEAFAPAMGLGLGRMSLLRLNKLFRLGHVFVYYEHMQRHLTQTTAFKRIVKLFAVLLVISHFVACMWIVVADGVDKEEDSCLQLAKGNHSSWTDETNCTTTWRRSDLMNEGLAIELKWFPPGCADYVRALYFAIVGMSTIGYGDIVPTIEPTINSYEAWYTTCVIMIGGLIYPATIGGMASLMSNLGAARTKYNTMLFQLRGFISREALSRQLQNRIIKFYDYRWTRKGGIDEIKILNGLPGHLRKEVSGRISQEVCDHIPFFESCDQSTVEKLVAHLEPAVFLPDDVIIRTRQFGKEMFFLERGLVQVTDHKRSITFGLLHGGDYFGEGALLQQTFRSATCVALIYCDCFVLTRDSFFEGLRGVGRQQRDAIMDKVREVFEKKKKKNLRIAKNLADYDKLSTTMGFSVPDAPELQRTSWKHPESNFRYSWDIVVLIIILWNTFLVPARIGFLNPYATPVSGFFIVDYLMDGILMVDAILTHNRFAYLYEGMIVGEVKDIRKNNRQTGNMWKTMLESCPLDLLAIPFLGTGNYGGLVLSLCRIPKLLRLRLLFKYTDRLERALEDWHFFIKASSLRLVKLAFGILGVAHWAACLFYVMTRFFNDNMADALVEQASCAGLEKSLRREVEEECRFSEKNNAKCVTPYAACQWNGTWIKHQIEEDLLPPWGGYYSNASYATFANWTPAQGFEMSWHYVRSLNWALPTLVVVVIGDVIPVTVQETMFCVVVFLIGLIANAAVIGNIASLIANLDTTQGIFQQRKTALDVHLLNSGMSDELRVRARNYLDYLWDSQQGFHWDILIENLPVSLRRDIKSELMLALFRKSVVFQETPEDVLGALSEFCNLTLYNPGDGIINAGDASTHIYFVKKGSLDVVYNGAVVASLEEGNFFGESALLVEKPRIASVFASNCVELFEIHRESFQSVMRAHPEEKQTILNRIQHRVSQNKTINKVNKAKTRAVRSSRMSLSDYDHGIALLRERLKSGKQHCMERLRFAFRPSSSKVVVWDLVALVLALYWIVTSPMKIAFNGNPQWTAMFSDGSQVIWSIFEMGVEGFFITDVVMKMYVFPFTRQGRLVVVPRTIRAHYFRSGFATDMLSSLPLELITTVAIVSGSATWNNFGILTVLRFLRLLKLFRLPSYLYRLFSIIRRLTEQDKMVLLVFTFYFLFHHIYGCIWVFFHHRMTGYHTSPNSTADNSTVIRSWATKDGLCPPDDHLSCQSPGILYVRGLYFVITVMSTVGYGDIRPYQFSETLFNMMVVLSGAIFFAAIIGAFQALFAHWDSQSGSTFKAKMDQITKFMDFRDLPPELRRNVRSHYRTVWRSQRGVNVQELMQDLPASLRMDLMHYQFRNCFQNVFVLSDCELSMQKRMSLGLKHQAFVHGSVIYEAGSVDDFVYFLLTGCVVLQGADTKAMIKEHVYPGGHFGESVLSASKAKHRKVSATAEEACQIYSLSRTNFQEIIALSAMEEQIRIIKSMFRRGGLQFDHEEFDASTVVVETKGEPTTRKRGSICVAQRRKTKRETEDQQRLRHSSSRGGRPALIEYNYPSQEVFESCMAAEVPIETLLRNAVVLGMLFSFCEKRCIAEHVMFWIDWDDYLDLFEEEIAGEHEQGAAAIATQPRKTLKTLHSMRCINKLEGGGEDVLLRQKKIAFNRIYDTFLCSTAKHELCFSKAEIAQVYAEQDHPKRTTFDILQQGVEQTIRKTILPEFMQSSELQAYVALYSAENPLIDFCPPEGKLPHFDTSIGEELSLSKHIFKDSDLFTCFSVLCQEQHCFHHLLFHYQVQNFTRRFGSLALPQLQHAAYKIYNSFIVDEEESPFFVDLPAASRKRVGRQVATPTFEMFEECDKRLRARLAPLLEEFAGTDVCQNILERLDDMSGQSRRCFCCGSAPGKHSSTVVPDVTTAHDRTRLTKEIGEKVQHASRIDAPAAFIDAAMGELGVGKGEEEDDDED